jgi:methionine--tRNA ligase beta chain
MTNLVSFDDFSKIDIRVGTVIKAEVPSWSHWVMKLTVDFGPGIGEKIIFSGIMKFYSPSELVDKQFPFVINLKPKKIGPEGDFSNGMLMAVATGDTEEDKPILFNLKTKVENGSKVV